MAKQSGGNTAQRVEALVLPTEMCIRDRFKATPLEDSFSANFNILVSGQPRVMGVREILPCFFLVACK